MKKRQRESCGFAGTRLRAGQNIPTPAFSGWLAAE